MIKRFVVRPATICEIKGFTLVEALVAGLLSVFVIWVAVALFSMNAKQVSGSFVRSLTNMQYQTVIEQIGSKVRKASVISSNSTKVLDASGAEIQSDTIFLFDTTLAGLFGGYCRVGTALKEWNGAQFINFKVGTKNIKAQDTGKTFKIMPDRKSVLLNLFVIGVDGSTTDTMKSNGENFKCRN